MTTHWHCLIALFLGSQACILNFVQAALEPATAREAAAVLDLTEFPLVNPVGEPNTMVVAQQSYIANGKVTDVSKKLQAMLKEAGCTELEGATFTDAYGSAYYRKGDFVFSLSLSPGAKPEQSMVVLTNHGNLDLKSIPILEGATEQYAMPSVVSYVSELPADVAQSQLKELLVERGWQLFGDTTVSFFVKKNAVIVQCMVTAAPALQGKTVIQLSSEQMSVDIPTPPYDGVMQYTDGSGGMLFDSRKSQAEIVEFFKKSLGDLGWKSTTEDPVKIDFREHLIFRNPENEYLELDFQAVDGLTRTRMRYQNAKQFEESERIAKEAIAQKQKQRKEEMDRKNNPSTIEIVMPAKSKVTTAEKTSIEFSIASGSAQGSMHQWIAQYKKMGWEVEQTIDEKQVGEYSLTKESAKMDVSFVDPGFIPGSITIRTIEGYQLQFKK